MRFLTHAPALIRRAILLLIGLAALAAHAQITVTLSVAPFSGGVVAQGEAVNIGVTVSNSSGLSFTNITFNLDSTANVTLIGGFFGGSCVPPPSVLSVNPQRVAVTVPALGPGASCGFIVSSTATAPGPATLTAPALGQVTAGGFEQYLINALPATEVTNTNLGDANSLNSVMQYVNSHCTGSDTITFNIPGAGPHTIPGNIGFALSCDNTVIDGYSQPGSAPNTDPVNNNAVIQIIRDGTSCGCGNGLQVAGNNITVRGLAIRSFLSNGITVNGAGNMIKGNYIGTDPGGMTAFGNGLSGVSGNSDFATIGGPDPADANLITGNQGYQSSVGGSNVTYQNNQIGGDRAGGASIVSVGEGLYLTVNDNVAIVGNRIRNNGSHGITLTNAAYGIVDSNIITGNGGAGVNLQYSGTSVNSNTISGNAAGGIAMGNLGFHDASGNLIEMNGGDGILITSSHNDVTDNTVRGNSGAGIRVDSGTNNALLQNLAHGNAAGAGIVLGAGPGGLLNDEAAPPYDTDTGPNELTNHPIISSAQLFGGNTVVTGELRSESNRPVRVDFFSVTNAAPPAGGEVFLGALTGVSLDPSGFLSFNVTLPGLHSFISATATVDLCSDGCDNTSEYSPAVASGVAPGPALGISPAALVFGPQPVGTISPPQTVTVSNPGPGPVTFTSITSTGEFQTMSSCGATLAMGESCFIDADFRPLAMGARGGSISIVSDAAVSPLLVSLSGTGTAGPRPAIALQPDSLTFEAVDIGGTSERQAIRVFNSGNGDLNFRGFDTFGDFTILLGSFREQAASAGSKRARKASRVVVDPPYTTCGTHLFAGDSCIIVIVFEPTANGPREGQLVVDSDAPTPSVSARLFGRGGTGPTNSLELVNVLDFGEQPFGQRSAGRELVVRNLTTERVTLMDLVIEGSDFTVGDTCREIAARESCTLVVFFEPTVLGLRSGVLTIRNQAEAAPYRVELRGLGVPNPLPLLRLSVQSIGFGSAAGPRTAPVRITNTGQLSIVLTLVSATGDFMAVSRCGTTLPVGESCDVDVTFFALLTGPRNGALQIQSNASGSPHSVELSAVGCRTPSAAFGRTRTLLCAPGN